MSETVTSVDQPNDGQSFQDVCSSFAPEVGFAAGAVYDEIAGPAVGSGVGGYVTEHWSDTCALPGEVEQVFERATSSDGSDYGGDTEGGPSDGGSNADSSTP